MLHCGSRRGQRSATRQQTASKCSIAAREVDLAWSCNGLKAALEVSEARRGNRQRQNAASRRAKSTSPGAVGA